VLIDEVHLVHEAGRGACLEAGVVCRLKMLSGLPEMAGVRGGAVASSWEAEAF
jgi:replicative superfamily II helicase